MNSIFQLPKPACFRRFSIAGFLAILISTASISWAQQAQLTLADLLIGLRSKKVTLEERNTILAGAVRERGITFSLSPEIEKELTTTGASKVLLDAVREKSVVAVAPKPTPAPVATPAPTPTPPGYDFYQTRADANFVKGEYALALTDYDKAVSLRSDSPIAFLNRGRAHFSLKDFSKATADFDKSIELDPKDSRAYFNRGVLNESLGYLEKALADYSKAVDLDPTNETAKTNAAKIDNELKAKAAKEAAAAQPPVKAPEVRTPPESINVGVLTSANAVRMAKPVYSPMAQRSNIEGRVTVEVELDIEGNVTQAKAVSGHQFLRGAAEDAARKSKFKPAMFEDKPIKGIGTITYNFTLKGGS